MKLISTILTPTDLEKVLEYTIYMALFLLLVILPSVVMPELMHPTQSGKFFFFIYTVLFLSFLCLLKLLMSKSLQIKVGIIDILLFILLVYVIINRYFIQDIYGFSLRYYELLGISVMYLILRVCKSTIYPYLLLAIVISGIIQAIYGSLQFYGYFPSHHSGFIMTGSFFNPGPYAGFLAAVFPVSLGMYLFREKRICKVEDYIFEYIPFSGIIIILLVIPASQSRAAWVAVIVSSCFLLTFKYELFKKLKLLLDSKIKKALAIIVFLVLAGGLLTWIYSFKKPSADGRLLIWKISANMVKERPWFGYGFDSFKAHYMNFQAYYFRENGVASEEAMLADNVYYTFNTPLQFMVENGIVGFVLLLIAFLVQTYQKINNRLLFVTGGILSVISFSLFSYPEEILPIKLVFCTILGIMASGYIRTVFSFRTRLPFLSFFAILKSSFCLCVGILAIQASEKTMGLKEAYREWQTALNIYQFGLYSASLKEYEKCYPFFERHGNYLMNYGKALSVDGKHQEAIDILNKAERFLNTSIIQTALGDSYKAMKNYVAAEECYFQAWYMAPDRFYTKYLLVNLYYEVGNNEKALEFARNLLEKQPKIPSPAIEEIQQEMRQLLGNIK